MNLKSIDFKGFFLKYGEKVGLGVAAGIMLLLAISALMNAGTKGAPTKEVVQQKDREAKEFVSRKPGPQPADLQPPEVPTKAQLIARSQTFQEPVSWEALRILFPPFRKIFSEGYRFNLDTFPAEGLRGDSVHIGIRARDIRETQAMIALPSTAQFKTKPPKPGEERSAIGISYKIFLKTGIRGTEFQSAGAGGEGGGAGGMGETTPYPKPETPKPETPKGYELIPFKGQLKDIKALEATDTIAATLFPCRGFLVVGSYPHLRQLQAIAEVLQGPNATTKVKPEDIKVSYYKGLEVQRRQIVLAGSKLPDGSLARTDLVRIPTERIYKPLDPNDPEAPADGWVNVDHKHITWLMRMSYGELEPEVDLKLDALIYENMAMLLPKNYRGTYPDLIKDMEGIKRTLDSLAEKKVTVPPASQLIPPDDLNPFRLKRTPPMGGEEAGGGVVGGVGGVGGIQPKPVVGGEGTEVGGEGTGAATTVIPENILIRFLDVDPIMRPGQTYQYRVRVILQNPTFKAIDVANPQHALQAEVKGPWSQPTAKMTLPGELFLYVDDQKVADRKDADKAPFQVHKWLDWVRKDTDPDPIPVGDWWVERKLVAKGEYIGKVGDTEMVVWNSTAPDPGTGLLGVDTIQPNFRTDAFNTRALLVDFDGGLGREAKFAGRSVAAPYEVLMIDLDGKLIARSQLGDKVNEVRKTRQDNWAKWKEAVKKKLTKRLWAKEQADG